MNNGDMRLAEARQQAADDADLGARPGVDGHPAQPHIRPAGQQTKREGVVGVSRLHVEQDIHDSAPSP